MIVYPHRITPFEQTICDVCKTKLSQNLLLLDAVPFKGLQYCDNIRCKNVGSLWLNSCTISLDELIKTYSDTFSVERSNGCRETGWSFSSPAFQQELNGKYCVKITNKSNIRSKFTTLDLLCEWNPTFDSSINNPELSPTKRVLIKQSFSNISLSSMTHYE